MKDLTCFEPKFKTLGGYIRGEEDFTLQNILSEVSSKSGISEDLIKADTRKIESFKGKYFYYRRVFETQHAYTFAQIGAVVGRDHSSVTMGLKRGNEIYKGEYDKIFKTQKPILIMFKNGKPIKSYNSIHEASKKTGLSRANIYRNLHGVAKVKGFEFRYAK